MGNTISRGDKGNIPTHKGDKETQVTGETEETRDTWKTRRPVTVET